MPQHWLSGKEAACCVSTMGSLDGYSHYGTALVVQLHWQVVHYRVLCQAHQHCHAEFR